ncbi:MAG: hypothetical protein A2513_07915 [Sulfurimonas sp. RIFOXYD12_FULL_33_39]|nr:MAG: hypothetical protein A3G74_05955 [Sulfurimonas sp. RIFCSPLOWO2_12_FULL_34_6]OHE10017.1 MAG: hypothetical protein A2513_07915 [Sulfurimonas sp. RIFOXYD12_FULL_33_39]OHE14763.1 MAG: hypothetical protein A2530_02565 [Sulfurimonas sp. RIFOXYD2_FULL_34_21]
MNKKSKSLFYAFLTIFGVFILESIYLNSKSMDNNMLNLKNDFTKVVGLPDLAISTEASFIRHRTMSNLFSIYKDDPSLREYFPSTYTYTHSHIINQKSLNAQ